MADEQRFDPMKELNRLRNQVETILEQGIQTVQEATTPTGMLPIRVNMYEVNNEVIIRTNAIDGIVPDSIDVSMEDDMLTLKGTTVLETTPPRASYFLQERKFGDFSRTVRVPIPVLSEQASAKLKNGTLVITLPVDLSRYQEHETYPVNYDE